MDSILHKQYAKLVIKVNKLHLLHQTISLDNKTIKIAAKNCKNDNVPANVQIKYDIPTNGTAEDESKTNFIVANAIENIMRVRQMIVEAEELICEMLNQIQE
ncbi:hypothetical protein BDAP_000584 [Binucleata daphniae]